MAKYHVGCGKFGIYAGILNPKNKDLWKDKSDVTDETLCAVRDYMILDLIGGLECMEAKSDGYEWTLNDGRIVELRITIKEANRNG